MERSIRFRAWDANNNKMIDGDMLFINEESDGGSASLHTTISALQSKYNLMQYTGLKDKNAKEIYEGDIVSLTLVSLTLNEGPPFEETVHYSIRWGAWCLMRDRCGDSGNSFSFDAINARSCEIIGNIYENPELLNN